MLESLFAEETANTSIIAGKEPGARIQQQSSSSPPDSRPACGLSGVANLGATCYLNSLLQTLLYTPEFRESLFRLKPEELGDTNGDCKEKNNSSNKVRVIPIELQRLFAHLLLLDQSGVSAVPLIHSFGWDNNEELQQHDVQELNRILFGAIESSLVGTSGHDLISRLYHGTIVNQIICKECGRISEREEAFLDLTVVVSGNSSLQQALQSAYRDTELMCLKNQYRCEACSKLVDATKGAKLRSLPPILTVSLLRFSYDFAKMERFKETGRFTFPLHLDASPYCENVVEPDYELFSVVVHKGSTHGGHYFAYIKDIDGLGHWTLPEEEPVRMSVKPEVGGAESEPLEVVTPQELLATLLVTDGGQQCCLPVDKLCQSLTQQTGFSWNKRYKRKHGPITKFLNRHSDTFEVQPTTKMVYLKSGDTKQVSTATEDPAAVAAPPAQECNGDGGAHQQTAHSPRRKGWLFKESGDWFCFDDARVYSVQAGDIEAQFSGKESAYMLFYRSRSLARPQQGRGRRSHMVPEHLVREVVLENIQLAKQREEHLLSLNSVAIRLLSADHYRVACGGSALVPLDPAAVAANTVISIDRRKTIAELKIAISERLGEGGVDVDLASMCLHLAGHLPAGLHLYNSVSGDNELSVQECLATESTVTLFLWDGKQVGSEPVQTGVDSEPVLLTIADGDRGSEVTQGFPGCLRVGQLALVAGELLGAPAARLQLGLAQEGAPVDWWEAAEHDGKTLRQLGLQDGHRLQARLTPNTGGRSKRTLAKNGGAPQGGASAAVTPSTAAAAATSANASLPKGDQDLVRVTVEDRCSGQKAPDQPWTTFDLQLPKDETVKHLKTLILSHLQRLDGSTGVAGGGRLRVDMELLGLKPPLHEDLSLKAAGIKEGSRVVIEPGTPPKPNELTITCGVGDIRADQPDLEFVLDKSSTTVGKVMSLLLEKAGLEGGDWHLAKANWCGEASSPLDNPAGSLESEGVEDGAYLLLGRGSLPPRGHLRLPVWLFPTPTQADHDGGSSGAGGNDLFKTMTLARIKALLKNAQRSHDAAATATTATTAATTPSPTGSPATLDPAGSEVKVPVWGEPGQVWRGALVGRVQVSREATLEEVKLEVAGLEEVRRLGGRPFSQDLGRLRLRLVEEGRPGRILRHPQQMIRKQKVTASSELAAQILLDGEELGPQGVVLDVWRRDSEGRSYSEAGEVVWDTGRGCGPLSLRECLARHLGAGEAAQSQLVAAKYWPDQHRWTVLQEQAANKQNNKGKKNGRGKVNLKQAPYCLKDGSIIGVKDLQQDPDNRDDFSTAQDDLWHQQAKLLAEEKRKRRREKSSAAGDGGVDVLSGDSDKGAAVAKSQRRPEVGIKIQVGDFR